MLRVLLFVLVLAGIIYVVFWSIGRRNGGPEKPTVSRGPVGPDDDEDFLRQLDWERRRDAQRKRHEDEPPPEPTG